MLLCFVVVIFALCYGWGLKECVWSIRCLAKFGERLAVLNAFLCSRNHVARLRPVCPTYAFPQSGYGNL